MKTELCAGTAEAVRIARSLAFDRVELCQELETGGITPSAGLQSFALKFVETHILIRPRGGDFVYSQDEKEVMLSDIDASRRLGMHGIVTGALTAANTLDTDWLNEARRQSKDTVLTFHRAFDEATDWQEAMEQLIEAGFTRILTSGQAKDVHTGMAVLQQMKAFAKGRIEIMAGGGVSVENVREVLRTAAPDAIHFSGTVRRITGEGSNYATEILVPDPQKIQDILREIRR